MPAKSPHTTDAAAITKAASTQTYYTILFLADRGRVADAFRAYGYFRWLDDQLDQEGLKRPAALDLVERQNNLMQSAYEKHFQSQCHDEEKMLTDLIQSDTEENSGLRMYIQHLMAVMEFDAQRRGKLITARELENYSFQLASAVSEAMHFFIGHDLKSPRSENRYQAVIGAHITHMLRDTLDDVRSGYYNIPQEYLEKHSVTAREINSEPYRAWVKDRIRQARACFEAGRDYLIKVENLRFRIAAFTYMKRFEKILSMIEQDHFVLRPHYDRVRPFRSTNRFNWGWPGTRGFSSKEGTRSQPSIVHYRVGERL